jgi:hypothetical protein
MMLLGDFCMLSNVFFVEYSFNIVDLSLCLQHIQVQPVKQILGKYTRDVLGY